MKTIVLYGDSITDMSRDRSKPYDDPFSLGIGYSNLVSSYINYHYPNQFKVINSGVGGDQITHLITRAPSEVYKYEPDYVSILIGVNDAWGYYSCKEGSDPVRFEKYYRCLLDEFKQRIPNAKVMILECFNCKDDTCTEDEKNFIKHLHSYSDIEKKLAEEYGCVFVPLFDKMSELVKENGMKNYLYDGTHPNAAGAMFIAESWINAFEKLAGLK